MGLYFYGNGPRTTPDSSFLAFILFVFKSVSCVFLLGVSVMRWIQHLIAVLP